MTEDIHRPAGDPSTLDQPRGREGGPPSSGTGSSRGGGQSDMKDVAKQEAGDVAATARSEAGRVTDTASKGRNRSEKPPSRK